MSRTIIPKDCCLCDVCNQQLTDENFIALEDCMWYVGWLYCIPCDLKYEAGKEMELIREIKKGDDLSNTDLAKPIVMESWDLGES